MPSRAMNNGEREAAKTLKELGLHIFSEYSGGPWGGLVYYAKHPKLIFQYDLKTSFNQALDDLKNLTDSTKPEPTQLTLNI